jgi:outer membrane biosynthesis protein TonB
MSGNCLPSINNQLTVLSRCRRERGHTRGPARELLHAQARVARNAGGRQRALNPARWPRIEKHGSQMNALRQIVAGNPRMGSALLGSALFHFAILVAVSYHLHTWHTRTASPSEFHDPLRARIVTETRVDEREEPSARPPAPVIRPAPQARPGAVISRPGPEMAGPAEAPKILEAPTLPEQAGRRGEPGAPFGVRARETLFTRPYPRRFSDANPLLNGQGYVRDIDLEERPRPITFEIPEYPPSALATSLEGWVTVAFFLDEKGHVVHAWPVESSEQFQPFEFDLVSALRGSVFTPGKVKGRPVKSITFQTLRFNPRGWPGQRSPEGTPQTTTVNPN